MTLPHARSFERSVPPARTGAAVPKKPALYTPEERARRDASPWTLVQAILAPLQFLVFAISLALVLRFLLTGEGYVVATASILAKTLILYLIMITGSVWEKEVFGKWLFARAFFWEDVFSMLVLALHTAYLAALLNGWGTPQEQMLLAVAAYATYVINAGQFLLKLREARLESRAVPTARPGASGHPAFFEKTSSLENVDGLLPSPPPQWPLKSPLLVGGEGSGVRGIRQSGDRTYPLTPNPSPPINVVDSLEHRGGGEGKGPSALARGAA